MKYKEYRWWLFSGVGCFVLLFNLFNVPQWVSIILEIISIFSGGIFGSTVVAIFVEKISDHYFRLNLEKQKQVVTKDVVRCLQLLVKNEFRNFNIIYGTIYKQTKKQLKYNLYDASKKLYNYSGKLFQNLVDQYRINVIDENFILIHNMLENNTCLKHIGIYRNLNKMYSKLLDNKEYYLVNSILEDSDLDILVDTFGTLEDIILNCENKNIDIVLELKQYFFEKVINFINYFKLRNHFEKYVYTEKLFSSE